MSFVILIFLSQPPTHLVPSSDLPDSAEHERAVEEVHSSHWINSSHSYLKTVITVHSDITNTNPIDNRNIHTPPHCSRPSFPHTSAPLSLWLTSLRHFFRCQEGG